MANELVIPPDILPESPSKIVLVDDQTMVFQPQFGRGGGQRNSFADPRWRFTHRYRGLRQKDQTRMHAVASEAQGRFRTVMVGPGQANGGSMSAPELFTNSTFDGVTGWSTNGPMTRTANNGVMRCALNAAPTSSPELFQNVLFTQYAPYCLRTVLKEGQGLSGLSIGGYVGGFNSYSTTRGYLTVTYVSITTTTDVYPVIFSFSSGAQAGSYIDLPFTSVSRCFLVDGGGNRMLQSDVLGNAAWSKGAASVTDNSTVAPDGTTTGDSIIENGATSQHNINQSGTRTSVAADLCGYGFFKQGVGANRNIVVYVGNTTANYSWALFNIAAGTVGSVTNVGTATNGRAFIVDAGGGWYFCAVVSKNVAATTILTQFGLHNGVSDSYTGNTTSSVIGWRCGGEVSSVPTRGAQTTSAAVAAVTQQSSNIYVKGLPVSTNGLLEVGDQVEIDKQIKFLVADLNSDAAGLGYLQLDSPFARALPDNTPIIVEKPMAKFYLANDPEYSNEPGDVSQFQFEFVQDLG